METRKVHLIQDTDIASLKVEKQYHYPGVAQTKIEGFDKVFQVRIETMNEFKTSTRPDGKRIECMISDTGERKLLEEMGIQLDYSEVEKSYEIEREKIIEIENKEYEEKRKKMTEENSNRYDIHPLQTIKKMLVGFDYTVNLSKTKEEYSEAPFMDLIVRKDDSELTELTVSYDDDYKKFTIKDSNYKTIKTSSKPDSIVKSLKEHLEYLESVDKANKDEKRERENTAEKLSKEFDTLVLNSKYGSYINGKHTEYHEYDCYEVIKKSKEDKYKATSIKFHIHKDGNDNEFFTIQSIHGKFTEEQMKKIIDIVNKARVDFI